MDHSKQLTKILTYYNSEQYTFNQLCSKRAEECITFTKKELYETWKIFWLDLSYTLQKFNKIILGGQAALILLNGRYYNNIGNELWKCVNLKEQKPQNMQYDQWLIELEKEKNNG